MKKALINPIDLTEGYPTVVSVNDTEFPCTPAYYWVDCPDNTNSGMYYKDGQFYNIPEPPPPPPQLGTDTRTATLRQSWWSIP
jgi:hypothetical protein